MKKLVWYTTLVAIFLLGAPAVFAATAQGTPNPLYKFKIGGFGASRSFFVFFQGAGPSLRVVAPWEVKVTHMFTERVSLGLGYALANQIDNHTVTGTTTTGQPTSQLFRDERRDWIIPLTGHYVLRTNDSQKLRLGVTAGIMLAASSYSTRIVNTVDGMVTNDTGGRDSKSSLFAIAGANLSYRVAKRVDVIGEISWNRNLAAVSNTTYRSLGSRNGFTRNVSLGLNYHFNLKKPATL